MKHHACNTQLPSLTNQPFIDLVLVLLLFYVVVWNKPATTGLDLSLPSYPNCWIGKEKSYQVRLYANGSIEVSGIHRLFSRTELPIMLDELMRLKRNDPNYLNIASLYVDENLPVGDAVAVTQQLKQFGAEQIFWHHLNNP
ncbi:MAG TPA: hypothetical protein DCS87_09120 [Rheinheimera sp.]|nr:hypothetical protein [Rheinheimera sp.]